MNPDQEEPIGEILNDRYHLGRVIARTDAGVVYEGKDIELRRSIAVEVASSLEEAKERRRWLREAMIAQQLVGEHVLRVLDVGESRGVPFAVRETATRTLADELAERGVIPTPQAVGWTLDACEAIAEAHAQGIPHGDVTLDNVHLAAGTDEPKVKVAWTGAATAERTAREHVAHDVAGLGAMVRLLTTSRSSDDADDGSRTTIPDGLAHAVARSLTQEPEGGFHSIAELARTLAPYAPPGHTAARNIAKILSRAGIVSGAIAPAELPRSAPVPRAPARGVEPAGLTDEWFDRPSEGPYARERRRGIAPALVSIGLLAAVLGGTWFLWDRGMLPQWTGTAPPEQVEVGTTELTSGSWGAEDHALDLSNAAATDPSLHPLPGATEPPAPAEEEAP